MILMIVAALLALLAALNLWLCLEVHLTRKRIEHLIDRMFLK